MANEFNNENLALFNIPKYFTVTRDYIWVMKNIFMVTRYKENIQFYFIRIYT